MPAIVTPAAIRAFLAGGFGVVTGWVLVGTVEEVSVDVESVLVVVAGGGF
jgi:hypothetical protein